MTQRYCVCTDDHRAFISGQWRCGACGFGYRRVPRPRVPSLDDRAAYFRRAGTTVAEQVRPRRSPIARLVLGTLKLIGRVGVAIGRKR